MCVCVCVCVKTRSIILLETLVLQDRQDLHDLRDFPLRCAGPCKFFARRLTSVLTRVSGYAPERPDRMDGRAGWDGRMGRTRRTEGRTENIVLQS